MTADVFLAEKNVSLLEDIRVEHLRLVVELEGEEPPSVVIEIQLQCWVEFWRHLEIRQNSDVTRASNRIPAVAVEEFLPSNPSLLLLFFFVLGYPLKKNGGFFGVAWPRKFSALHLLRSTADFNEQIPIYKKYISPLLLLSFESLPLLVDYHIDLDCCIAHLKERSELHRYAILSNPSCAAYPNEIPRMIVIATHETYATRTTEEAPPIPRGPRSPIRQGVIVPNMDIIALITMMIEVFPTNEGAIDRVMDQFLKTHPPTFNGIVTFFGHIVSEVEIFVDPTKVKPVMDWLRPSTITKIHSFIGIAGSYRRFVEGFSSIGAPLTRLTQKSIKLIWSNVCEQSFQKLKSYLVYVPILTNPYGVHDVFYVSLLQRYVHNNYHINQFDPLLIHEDLSYEEVKAHLRYTLEQRSNDGLAMIKG
ncbi:hypothetical protein KFK09_003682 [Dendrobium nobile]|uniref:Uncharacterized protein n=1 Tax=Dendrobium nobile TaxID=94219 RepID=A0A8T3BYB8_DENNO|nr:hypothetical protein KFK09_003682 [Dendrobium nobile]